MPLDAIMTGRTVAIIATVLLVLLLLLLGALQHLLLPKALIASLPAS